MKLKIFHYQTVSEQKNIFPEVYADSLKKEQNCTDE